MKYAAFLLLALCSVANAQTGSGTILAPLPKALLLQSTVAGGCARANASGTLEKIACPPTVDRSWHLMSITYGGTVTLLKDLTHHEAQFMYDRLMGLPATAKEKAQAAKQQADDEKEFHSAELACRHGNNSPEWNKFLSDRGYAKSARTAFFSNPWSCFDGNVNENSAGQGHFTEPGDIKSAEIFQ